MSRTLTSFAFAVLALASLAGGTANAKECKTDSDCASGFECALGVNVASGTGGSTGSVGSGGVGVGAAVGTACAGPDCPVSSPTAPKPVLVDGGALVPQIDLPPSRAVDAGGIVAPPKIYVGDGGTPMPVSTTGTCQVKILSCASKADCPANLDCVKQTVVVPRSACAPNTTCDTWAPSSSETGTCKAVCNLDSDCPAPLVCKLQGQTCTGGAEVSADGTVTTIPTSCTGGNKICSYEPVTCSTDAECKAPNYQCAKVSESQSCAGSAPAGCPITKGDAAVLCVPTPPEPPVCTSTVVNNCIPKEIRCDAGQACPSGWSCFDFSYFDGASVPGWSTPMPSKACLPDGLILAVKGQANGGSSTTYGSTPTRDGSGSIGLGGNSGTNGGPVSTTGDSTPPQVTPGPAPGGQEHVAANDAGAEAASPKVRDGGCSLGGAQDGRFGLWLTLGLAGLVLRLVRRRK